MARQVGGGIAIVSVPDVGTTVRVYLPRAAPETPRRPSGEQRTIPGDALATDQRTILLVEDDGTLRASIRRALLQAGFEVLDAAGGAEALVVNETHPEKIHLLVTDVVMPDVSGRELASRMRALRPDLKVLFMSGFSAETIRASGGLGSSEAFVQKPFTPSALVGAVRGLVEFL
jgi:CheY-like chemotaxis protein